eukprot:244760-Chlamydomonas_euryale.AAC.1
MGTLMTHGRQGCSEWVGGMALGVGRCGHGLSKLLQVCQTQRPCPHHFTSHPTPRHPTAPNLAAGGGNAQHRLQRTSGNGERTLLRALGAKVAVVVNDCVERVVLDFDA